MRHPRDVYVSGLGAPDSPVAAVFNVTLLTVGACGLLLAAGVTAIRGRADRLGRILGAAIALAGVCFVIASQVTCTAGCPLPGSPTFAVADAVHVTFAVVGFAAGCGAILLAALRASSAAVRWMSMLCGVTVGVVALAGALIALTRIGLVLGPTMEFAATTIALVWCGWFGLHTAWSREDVTQDAAPEPGPALRRRDAV